MVRGILSYMSCKISPRAVYDLVTLVALLILATLLIFRYAPDWIVFENFFRTPAASVDEETPAPSFFDYTDSAYGFSFRLPSSWQGMIVSRRTVSWAGAGSAPTIDFSLSSQGETGRLFSVHVLDQAQWNEIGSFHDIRLLGERGEMIFVASTSVEIPEVLGKRAMEIEGILETFKAT